MLLARIYEVFPLVCSHCGAEMRIIAFITAPAPMRDILGHLGEPTAPPRIAPARGPPLWDLPDAGAGDCDPHTQPAPEFRDECLNEHWFENLQQARIAVAAWRQDYNEVRPHSSCQRMPPAQFAARHRQQTADATLPKVEGTV